MTIVHNSQKSQRSVLLLQCLHKILITDYAPQKVYSKRFINWISQLTHLTNILPTNMNWFRLVCLPIFYPSKISHVGTKT